jgi:hypothetical protein
MTRAIHLCGSVPLGSAAEVFKAVGASLGDRVARYPDGETGARLDWLQWQTKFLRECPQLEEFVSDSPYRGKQIQFRKRAEVAAGDLTIGPLGYAASAIQSYGDFLTIRRTGEIPADTQLLVSLPTPLACARVHIAWDSLRDVEPAYEQAMRNEIAEMRKVIPEADLAIQWDVAVEFSILEVRPAHFKDRMKGVVDRLVERINEVPHELSAGLHLCYGDSGHKHFKEPDDTAKLVEVANAVTARATRDIDWLHLPVPKERDDERYYAPLRNLKLKAETELYLGLIHLSDGVAGAQRRIAAARSAIDDFGVATECGFGRRASGTIPELLKLHFDVSNL